MTQGKAAVLAQGWKLDTDGANIGRAQRWYEQAPGLDTPDAPVPGIIQQVFPEYHGVVWYRLVFQPDVLASPAEQIILHFGAVDYYAEVWLNGAYLGEHEGGETPFELNITATLKPATDNLLAVRVINPCNEPIDGFVLGEVPHSCKVIPYRVGATYDHGGIVLPVELLVMPVARIVDVFARPDPHSGRVTLAITLLNATPDRIDCRLLATIGTAATGTFIASATNTAALALAPGQTTSTLVLEVTAPRLWSPDDPALYSVTLLLQTTLAGGTTVHHTANLRCGFREVRVGDDGFFRLNGRRIFLRSSHTVNNFPIGLRVPHTADIWRRDLLYAKAAGMNMIRFIAGMAYPEQLNLCDELGLMVYQETYAGWQLQDSPAMAARFDRSIFDMIMRDRNHPSVVIWGLLNETVDNPVSRHAKGILPWLRDMDPTRLVVINSGRWDGEQRVGSVCNPGATTWQQLWGDEGPDTPAAPTTDMPAYYERVGDVHAYPSVPHTAQTIHFLRTLGADTKPVLLSEYGIGSLVDVIHVTRLFEQAGARPDLEDFGLYRTVAERFVADWPRWGMDGVYPFPQDMLRESQRLHSKWRTLGFNAIRSNPHLCGYNLTGTVDQVMTGEGLWTTWRELKPGTLDAVAEGLAPLRWCPFVEPAHGYADRPFTIEVVLANEQVLAPGTYPVRVRIAGPAGITWERQIELRVPASEQHHEPPLAQPVLRETVVIAGVPGDYCLAATMDAGGAPAGGRLPFIVADPAALPRCPAAITLLGIESRVATWLEGQGAQCMAFTAGQPDDAVIVVGARGPDGFAQAEWQALLQGIAAGATAIFLEPAAFRRGEDALGWLPLPTKGTLRYVWNWLYHREDVAKRHPIFDGLPVGILDWDYYGPVIPTHFWEEQDRSEDVAAATFAPTSVAPGGYYAGTLVSSYPLKRGHFLLNSLRILENVDRHPAADRLLLNMITYATRLAGQASIKESRGP